MVGSCSEASLELASWHGRWADAGSTSAGWRGGKNGEQPRNACNPQFNATPERKMRNPVACIACRTAKQRCHNNQDGLPCERCKSKAGSECAYPPPGTSAIHRKPKRPRPSDGGTADTPPGTGHTDGSRPPAGAIISGATPPQALFRRQDVGVPSGFSGLHHTPPSAALSPNAASPTLLEGVDPFDLLTDEVKNSYLRCSYKWSFHHTPTLLLRIRDRTLEPWLAWAIIALAIRYADRRPAPYVALADADMLQIRQGPAGALQVAD
jgi:hypothetical protein